MERNNIKKFPCPSCGYLMFEKRPGSLEVCQICFWQDDNTDLEKMYEAWGPNRVSLEQAQKNFVTFGAVEERLRENVRHVTSEDMREPNWRMLNRRRDLPREIQIHSNEFKELYYWYWNP